MSPPFGTEGEDSHCPGQDVLSTWWGWRRKMGRANQWSTFKLPSRQVTLHQPSPQDRERLISRSSAVWGGEEGTREGDHTYPRSF